jgi:hypothetical protein
VRRKAAIVTALVMLVGATAAYAATGFNNYSGTSQSFSKGVGSKKKPVGVSFKQVLAAKNNDPTKAAAVLTRIVVKTYGLVSNASKFPTCDASKFTILKSDKQCPKLSKFATGHVKSLLGDPTLAKTNRTPCNPDLDVFNGKGKGRLWFFFTTHSALQCAGLTTGATAPYPGSVSQKGKYQITNIPLPADISTRVANQPNFYGSLIHETLKWAKLKTKVKGKTVFNNVSVGCVKGKRPWTITYYSTTNGTNSFKQSVSGSWKC